MNLRFPSWTVTLFACVLLPAAAWAQFPQGRNPPDRFRGSGGIYPQISGLPRVELFDSFDPTGRRGTGGMFGGPPITAWPGMRRPGEDEEDRRPWHKPFGPSVIQRHVAGSDGSAARLTQAGEFPRNRVAPPQ